MATIVGSIGIGRRRQWEAKSVRNDVRRLREQLGLSQKALGERLGVSRQTINSIENGRYDPSLGLALDIGCLFGKPVERIFHDGKEDRGSGRSNH